MDLKSFLTAVVPNDGEIVTAHQTKSKGFIHHRHSTGDYAAAHASCVQHALQHDVYVAMASFKPGTRGRKGEHVQSVQSLWLDIDTGPDKTYGTVNEAIQALTQFRQDTGLPAPSIVNHSGHGLHVYWLLDNPVSEGDWRPIATALKAAHLKLGLAADAACTADIARVLRPPETKNYKNGQVADVISMHPTDPASMKRYRLDELKLALRSHGSYVQQASTSGLGPVPAHLLAEQASNELAEGIQQTRPIYDAQRAIDQCPWLTHVRMVGGADQDEPLWQRMLCVMSVMEDGKDHIHTLSRRHPGYSTAGVESKYAEILQKDERHRHVSCADIESNGGAQCATCPFKGAVKGPYHLGKAPETEDWPDPYRMDTGRGLQKGVTNSAGMTTWKTIWPVVLEAVKRPRYDGSMEVVIKATLKSTNRSGVLIPKEDLIDTRALRAAGLRTGIVITNSNTKDVLTAVDGWYDNIVRKRQEGLQMAGAIMARGPFGRVGGRFITPTTVHEGGQYTTTLPPPGDGTKWEAAAQFIIDQDHLPFVAMLAGTFAAPLVDYIPDAESCLVNFHTLHTGSGKTTTLNLALAAWGKADAPLMITQGSTTKAILKLPEEAGHLPVGFDEALQGLRPQLQSELVLQLANGAARSTLDRGSKRRVARKWSTMFLMCSNGSLAEELRRARSASAAAPMRIFSLIVPAPPKRERTELNVVYEGTRDWGVAGPKYLGWVLENEEQVKEKLLQIYEVVSKATGDQQHLRFQYTAITALVVGAWAASQAGVANFDAKRLLGQLVGQYQSAMPASNEELQQRNVYAILQQYLDEGSARSLQFQSMETQLHGRTAKRKLVWQQRYEHMPYVAYERGVDGFIRVPGPALTKWLNDNHIYGISGQHILQIPGVAAGRQTIGLDVDKSVPVHLVGRNRTYTYEIDTNHPEWQALSENDDP